MSHVINKIIKSRYNFHFVGGVQIYAYMSVTQFEFKSNGPNQSKEVGKKKTKAKGTNNINIKLIKISCNRIDHKRKGQ